MKKILFTSFVIAAFIACNSNSGSKEDKKEHVARYFPILLQSGTLDQFPDFLKGPEGRHSLAQRVSAG